MIIPSLPADLYYDNKLVGRVYARQAASSRLYIIDIDPRVLTPCPTPNNPNVMNEDSFQRLGQSIDKLEFGQSIAVGIPWSQKEQVTIRNGAVHLLVKPDVLDGTHRLEHALLQNLERLPAIWYSTLRRGEDKLIRAAFNADRGHIDRTILHQQMASILVEQGAFPIEDMVLLTGADRMTIENLLVESDSPTPLPGAGDLPGLPPMLPDARPENAKRVSLEVIFEDAATKKRVERALRKLGKPRTTDKDLMLGQGILSLVDAGED